MARLLLHILGIIWASPYTLLGLTVGALALCTGGRVRSRDGVIEFYGGAVRWFMTHFPFGRTNSGQSILAITLGHTILGQSDVTLDMSHNHEMVHVRQYERWGPFMGPAYLLASLVLWSTGRQAYRDNPFEREAYEQDDCQDS